MRKIVSILCIVCASVTLMAQTKSQEPVKGAHPYQDLVENEVSWEHAYWSIIPYVGVNIFDGDFDAKEAKSALGYPAFGLGVECSFNPAWSLGLEYDFNPWILMGNPNALDSKGARLNADTLLIGHAHMANLYVGADLINLIHPYAKKKPVSLIATVGAGGAMHKNSVYYDMSEKNTEGRNSRGNTAAHPNIKSSMSKYDFNPFLKFGLNLEFNINRSLALGLRGAYSLFMTDMIDGRQFNPNTDGVIDMTLNLRVKLEAVKKTHARNVAGRDFPDHRPILPNEARAYIKEEVSTLAPTQTIINEIHQDGPAVAAVPAGRDTVVIYHRDTIVVREEVASAPVVANPQATNAVAVAAEPQHQPRVYSRAAQNFYIYFDSHKADLNEAGLITIQQVADMMAEDESLYALIVAYCDNTGSAEANKEMGDKRAKNVAAELSAEHGIDAARLGTHNHGVVVGGRSKAAYAPNRRVAITLMDKDSFDKRKAELEEAKKK